MSEFTVTSFGSDAGGEYCADFRLSDEQVARFFARAKSKSASEIHQDADYLPCWIRGTAISKTGFSQWEVRAGGTATVTLPDGTVLLFACADCDALLGGNEWAFAREAAFHFRL
ncbi:hypothetical protein [Nevskia sp.]|uniref:hypothetical protein n=1 Tax=Nevskia sp. TaxID=1929292 RepID=UPI0025E1D86D|nr:hypothetical protein [Nevskia sp.]